MYEVEAIRRHKIKTSNHEKTAHKFLLEVKWVGYPQTTWESLAQFLQDVPVMVKSYFASIGKYVQKQ